MPNIKLPNFRMLTTANWKGYRASWAIIDEQMFLIGVEGKIKENEAKRLFMSGELFPSITFPYKVTS